MADSNMARFEVGNTMVVLQPFEMSVQQGGTVSSLDMMLETSSDASGIISAFRHRGFSWDDVLESIDSARKHHNTKAETRKISDLYKTRALITTLHSLTDMIPDQDGLSVMRGGLKLIFKVKQIPRNQAEMHCRVTNSRYS